MKVGKLYKYFFFPIVMVLIMWVVKIVELNFDVNFSKMGIFPRKTESLKGIILSPFIHGSLEHLISNTFPFLLLSVTITYFYRRMAYRLIIFCWLMTGFTVWLGGRYSWHIGASGLIYAFASFVFFAGILNKERQLIAISLLVVFLYGGMIWGIFPGEKGVSWESHLFGFISGLIFAYFFGKEYLPINLTDSFIEYEDFSETSYSHDININYSYKEKD